MTTSSIQRVYRRIRLDLQWSWIIFLVTNLVLAGFFFRILYTNLQDRAEAWTHLFEQRIVQTEALLGEGARFPLPLSVSNLSFNDRGTILKAFPERLEGLNIRTGAFFQKVAALEQGHVHVLFYPDLMDGKQRVYFVKRAADRFLAATFEAEVFFPPSKATDVSLALESRGVLLYATIPDWIGEPVWTSPVLWRSGRIYLTSATILGKTGRMRFFIIQDISRECLMAPAAGFFFLFIFWQIDTRTRRIRRQLVTLHKEHTSLNDLIQGFSSVSRMRKHDIAGQLDLMIDLFAQSMQKTKGMSLQFVESRLYLNVLQQFMEDIHNLLQKAGGDAQALQKAHDELEERVQQRTAELLTAKKEAERAQHTAESANRAKSEFLSHMSHELRTPLNAVLGFSEILMHREEDERKSHFIESIRSSGKVLLSLINDVLDLSKIEAGKLELHYSAVSPAAFVKELELLFSGKIQEKGVELITKLQPDIPKSLILDEIRLRQVCINLMGNAVKFTESGYIRFEIKCDFPDGPGGSRVDLLLSVEDTGRGIAASERDRIFESFRQIKGQTTMQDGGTGLGLAITRRLVEMMEGEITVESVVGRGSLFTVAAPGIEIAAARAPGEQEESPVDLERISFSPAAILVADDIDYNREMLTTLLAGRGFEFIHAENGREAMEQVRNHKPALILLDMKMPVMDGYEAAKRLKADAEARDIPVVAVTASALAHDEERISKFCDGYLSKPVGKSALIHELMRFLPYTISGSSEARETGKPRPAEGDSTARPLKAPPAAVLDKIIQAARNGFFGKLERLLNELPADDHAGATFCQDVKRYSRKYDSKGLLEYIERLEKG